MAATTLPLLGAAVLTILTVTVVVIVYVRDLRQGEAARDAAEKAMDRLREDVSLGNYVEYNRRELQQFSVQSRARARWSFMASLAAMSTGLGLLGLGLYQGIHNPNPVSKVVIAVLAAVGGTVSSYISRTFMELTRQSEKQLRYHFNQSVSTSFFLWAERLAQRITDVSKEEVYTRIIHELLAAAGKSDSRTDDHVRSGKTAAKGNSRG